MRKDRLIKTGLSYAILACLVYFEYGLRTAAFAIAMVVTVNLTIVVVPELVLVLLKRKRGSLLLFVKAVIGTVGFIGCFMFVPFKILAGMCLVTVLITAYTTWYALKNTPPLS